MGKGDKRTGKGKRFRGSYGNSRKQKPATTTTKKAPPRKPAPRSR